MVVFYFAISLLLVLDFGAGFFALHSKLTGDEKKINHLISRYLNPVWEVTNVSLFYLLRQDSYEFFFQSQWNYLGTVLLIPGSIALIMIS